MNEAERLRWRFGNIEQKELNHELEVEGEGGGHSQPHFTLIPKACKRKVKILIIFWLFAVCPLSQLSPLPSHFWANAGFIFLMNYPKQGW